MAAAEQNKLHLNGHSPVMDTSPEHIMGVLVLKQKDKDYFLHINTPTYITLYGNICISIINSPLID